MELTKVVKPKNVRKKITKPQPDHRLVFLKPKEPQNEIIDREQAAYMQQESVGDVDFYKCKECPYMTLSVQDLKFHWQSKHAASDVKCKKVNLNNTTVKCPGCSGLFYTENSLKTHLRSHHKMEQKDILKLTYNLIKEVKKNKDYFEKLEVVIEGAKCEDFQCYDSKNIPQVIEIAPDPSNLPINMTIPSVNSHEITDVQNCQRTINTVACDNYINIEDDHGPNEMYINNCSTILLNNNSLINVDTTADQKINFESKEEFYQDFAQLVEMSSEVTNVPVEGPTLPIKELPIEIEKPMIIDESMKKIHKIGRKKPKMHAKKGRHWGSKSVGITNLKKICSDETYIAQQYGYKCSVQECGVRLFAADKIAYHKLCHVNNTKDLCCPKCKKMFSAVETLHTHLWIHHQIDLELNSCDQCSYKSYSLRRLNNIHKKIHSEEKNYSCDICAKAFKNSKQLSNHKARHKSKMGAVKHVCDICGRDCNNSTQLQRHQLFVHENVKPFRCEHCDYSTARKSTLVLHMNQHTGYKPYQCSQCKFETADPNTLRRHLARHSQQKKYQCSECSYSCIQASSLKLHIKSKHPTLSTDMIHSCPYCSYKSVKKANYTTHLSTHANDDLHLSETSRQSVSVKRNLVSSELLSDSNQEFSTDEITIEIPCKTNAINNSLNITQTNKIKPKRMYDYREPEIESCEKIEELIDNQSVQYITDDHKIQECFDANTYTYHSAASLEDTANKQLVHRVTSENVNVDQNYSQPLNSSVQSVNINKKSSVPIILVKPNNSHILNMDAENSQSANIGCNLIASNPPGQLLTLPVQNSNIITNMADGVPRKKPKISVKSNLILKGPDNFNTFNLQQRLAFKAFNNELKADQFGQSSLNSQNRLMLNDSMITSESLQRMHSAILNKNSIPDLTIGHQPFMLNGINSSNYFSTSNFSFPNLHSAGMEENDIPSQSESLYMPTDPPMQLDNNQIFANEDSHTPNPIDVKLENKPFVPISSELSCVNMNDIFLENSSLINEIPKHTIPIKYENKQDILESYLDQDCLFDNTNVMTGLENVSIIEELPVSYDNTNGLCETDAINYKDKYYTDPFCTDMDEENEIIVIDDDTSCDMKSLSLFGIESKFGLANERYSPLVYNNVNNPESPVKKFSAPALIQQESNDSKHVKEKPRIISEVHITSDKSKIMNFAAVKNMGLKFEYPLIPNMEWILAPNNNQHLQNN